jgi:hypothetical protein
MAGLFEDILTNLKEKKQEGKISGGYRYKDGKINIGGGYYGDDSMLEIDVNKDGGNILFKKRFADGGSTTRKGFKGGGSDASTTSYSQSFDRQHGTNTASRANKTVDRRQEIGQRQADNDNLRIEANRQAAKYEIQPPKERNLVQKTYDRYNNLNPFFKAGANILLGGAPEIYQKAFYAGNEINRSIDQANNPYYEEEDVTFGVPKYKDGGSTNGSGDKAFTGKVKELMDDGYEFGEAVKEAMRQGYKDGGRAGYVEGGNVAAMEASIQKMYTDYGQAIVDAESLQKYGKSVYNITGHQRSNLKIRLNKYKSFIKENKRMPDEKEARVAGRKDKTITDAINKDGNKKTDNDIRKDMRKKGKTVRIYQGKVIFLDPTTQKQFTEDLTKRYLIAKNSTKAEKANILSNKDFYDKYFKGYSQSSVRTIIGNYKKAMDFEYVKLSPAEKTVSNTNRILAEIITQGGKRLSGTRTSQVHHLFQLGDKYVKASGRNFAIIDQKINAGMSGFNKTLNSLVKERVTAVDKITLEEFNTKNNDIDKRAANTVDRYNKLNPENKGLLNWRKLSVGNNNEVIRGKSIGGDYKARAFDPNNKTLIENLDPKGLREYRQLIAKKANINDLKKIPGVTTANEVQQPEKSKIRSMFDKFNVGNIYKNVRPGIDKFTTMFPGKADNAIAAAIDFPMMYMSGLPIPAAAASAGSMFLNKPNLGKGINIALESAALSDEERFLKKANERKEGIETILRGAPGKVKKYLTQGEKATYQNIEDYLPDDDLSGIRSIKGVQ